MLIKSQKELKLAVTGLRRELKTVFGTATPSHTQCLELMARALGKSTYAELLVGLPEELPKAVSAATPPRYPLVNLDGCFDLIEKGASGRVVDGRDFSAMDGTVEDILYCVASASCASRDSSGELSPDYEGDTDVNWDGQETRRNKAGYQLWQSDGGDSVSEARVILVPEWFQGPDDEDDDEDPQELPCREELLDAYHEYATGNQLSDKLKEELPRDGLASQTLDAIADVLGFALHRSECASLERMLQVR